MYACSFYGYSQRGLRDRYIVNILVSHGDIVTHGYNSEELHVAVYNTKIQNNSSLSKSVCSSLLWKVYGAGKPRAHRAAPQSPGTRLLTLLYHPSPWLHAVTSRPECLCCMLQTCRRASKAYLPQVRDIPWGSLPGIFRYNTYIFFVPWPHGAARRGNNVFFYSRSQCAQLKWEFSYEGGRGIGHSLL